MSVRNFQVNHLMIALLVTLARPVAAEPAESTAAPPAPVPDAAPPLEPASTGPSPDPASSDTAPTASPRPRTELEALYDGATTSSPAPRPEPATPPASPEGLRRPSYYLHVAPGVIMLNALDPKLYGYVWGFGGGRLFVRRRHLAVMLGGYFEHAHLPSVNIDFLRLGAESRIGASNERLFGYGLVRAGFDVAIAPKDIYDGPGRQPVLLVQLSFGAGIQGALGPRRRFLIGAEPAIDVVWPGVYILFRARAFLGWRF